MFAVHPQPFGGLVGHRPVERPTARAALPPSLGLASAMSCTTLVRRAHTAWRLDRGLVWIVCPACRSASRQPRSSPGKPSDAARGLLDQSLQPRRILYGATPLSGRLGSCPGGIAATGAARA